MLAAKFFHINAQRLAIDHSPRTPNHHPVGVVRPAQHKRRNRVARAGKAQVVEREERQIGLVSDCNSTDICAADALRRTFGRPPQGIQMSDFCSLIEEPANHERVTDPLHEIGIVIGRRPVDTKADNGTSRLEIFGPAYA